MAQWSEEEVRQALEAKQWLLSEKRIQHGIQFSLTDSTTKVNWFHTGKINVQGKASGSLKGIAETLFSAAPAFGGAANAPASPTGLQSPQEPAPKRVFVVHGHDHQSLDQLRLLLMDLQLEPVIVQHMPGSGDTLIEKLEHVGSTDYACVLLTPDDEGRARNSDDRLRPRARQNVILELGMVLARLGRQRVAILLKGKSPERPSDIDGLIYIPFSNHVKETKNKLVANLHDAGFWFSPTDLVKN